MELVLLVLLAAPSAPVPTPAQPAEETVSTQWVESALLDAEMESDLATKAAMMATAPMETAAQLHAQSNPTSSAQETSQPHAEPPDCCFAEMAESPQENNATMATEWQATAVSTARWKVDGLAMPMDAEECP